MTTFNAVQATNGGNIDAFATKLDGSGQFVYSTYIGGWAAEDVFGVALDNAANLYIAGLTLGNYPQHNPAQPWPVSADFDGFVSKIDPSGQFVYSTYVGGTASDQIHALKVDAAGNAYVTGHTNSIDYPTVNAAQGTDPDGSGYDAFATKIGPSGGPYVYSTYLGGNGQETMSVHPNRDLYPLGVDGLGRAHIVVGRTASSNFPTTPDAIQSNYKGTNDIAYVRLGAGGALEYSTYMGSVNSDIAVGLVVDGADAATVGGTTTNGGDFPTFNAAQGTYGGGGSDMFVARFGGSSNDPPVADAGADDTVECASPSGTSYGLDGSGSSDADGDGLNYAWYEGGGLIATGVAPSVVLSLGSHTIELIVNDGTVDSDPDEVVIDVVDTTAPVISLVGGAVTLESGIDAYSELGATALDACDGDLSGSVVVDASAVDANTPGSYAVTYNVSDGAGNAAVEVTRTVNVVDTTAPVIALDGADPQVLECGIDGYTELGATVLDASDGDISSGVVIDASAVDAGTPGSYTVTYDAMDNAGNVAVQVTRTVTVEDNTAPTIALNGDNPLTLACPATYVEPGAVVSDACDESPTLAITGAVDGSTPGTYTVTYTATDDDGNSAVATRTVVVEDVIPPTVSLNGSATVTLESPAPFVDPGVNFSDDCDLSPTLVVDAGGLDPTALGTYTLTYTVTDDSGNSAAVSRTVTVVDTTPPVISLTGASPQLLECPVPYAELGATVSDNNDGAPVLAIDASGVNAVVPGTYAVIYTATDASGNTTTFSRAVIVGDTTAPAIALNGDAVMTLECHIGVYAEPGATATDACDPAPTLVVSGAVDAATLGTYTVTYTATDGSGNTATATRTVHVVDTTAPTILALSEFPDDLDIEPGGVAVTLAVTAEDACDTDLDYAWSEDGNGLGADATVAATFGLGTHTVVIEVTDSSGNSTTDTVVLTVVDPAPVELDVTANPGYLWPPNHKYVDIALEITGSAAAYSATAVSDQADDASGKGDGKTTGDIRVTHANGSVSLSSNAAPVVGFDPIADGLELRAERAGKGGQSRTYTITVTALDGAGNAAGTASVALQVVHDQGAAKLVVGFAGDEAFGAANYPNPFNPETVIRYALPEAADVRLAVYNASGQEVRELIYAYQGAGAYEVRWNGRDQSGQLTSAGIYFYRLQAGAEVAVGKMLLVK